MLASQVTGEPVNNMATANIAKTQNTKSCMQKITSSVQSKHEEEAQPFPQNSSQKTNNFITSQLQEGNQ